MTTRPVRRLLRWALSTARSMGSEVEVFHAFESSVAWIDVGSRDAPQMAEHDQHEADALTRRVVDEVLDSVDADLRGVPVSVHAVRGHPPRVLLDAASEADLLVGGSRGRGGFAGVLLGSVSQRVAQHAVCPVVIVPGWAQSPVRCRR